MKNKFGACIITMILMFCITSQVRSQFNTNNVTMTVTGINEEYENKFKDKLDVFIFELNDINIKPTITPLTIEVSYKDGEGYINVIINYIHEDVFNPQTKYYSQNLQWSSWGKGISIWLIEEIFDAISYYKFEVAKKEWSLDKTIHDMTISVKLVNKNKDWVMFYAHNFLNNYGLYDWDFYKNVILYYNEKYYETKVIDYNSLEDRSFFFIDKEIELSGEKTGAYYFSKFFNIKE